MPESGESELFGKQVADLQENIIIEGDSISGNLKYVTGYTGFSSKVSEQSGNYLALKISTVPSENVTTTVELVGGTKGAVTLDSDMNIVLRIANKDTQSVKIISTTGNESAEKLYTLTGITMGTAG